MFILSWPDEDCKGVVVFYKEEVEHKQWFRERRFVVGLYVPIGELPPRVKGDWAFVMAYGSAELPFDARHFTPNCYESKGEELSEREREYTHLLLKRVQDRTIPLHHAKDSNYDIFTVVKTEEMLRMAMMNCPEKLTIFILWDCPKPKPAMQIPVNVTLLKAWRSVPDLYVSKLMRMSKCYLALESNHHIAGALCLEKPILIRSDFMDHWIGLCGPENTMYTTAAWWGKSAIQMLANPNRPRTIDGWKLKYDYSWSGFQKMLSDIVPDYAEVDDLYEDSHTEFRERITRRDNATEVKGEVQATLQFSLSPSSTSAISGFSIEVPQQPLSPNEHA